MADHPERFRIGPRLSLGQNKPDHFMKTISFFRGFFGAALIARGGRAGLVQRDLKGWAATWCLAAFFCACASAQTYDVSLGFSMASNPASVWSYGWVESLGGPLTLLSY